MTHAELANLLRDCLTLWEVPSQVRAEAGFVVVETAAGRYTIKPANPATRPIRWLLQTPERRGAGRPARAIPSLVALLSALRNQLGGTDGGTAKVGVGRR
jgi:hypothetical protein